MSDILLPDCITFQLRTNFPMLENPTGALWPVADQVFIEEDDRDHSTNSAAFSTRHCVYIVSLLAVLCCVNVEGARFAQH